MEQNYFKLFEKLNETILDIYDFILRYLKTVGLSIFRPKVFYEIISGELPYKRIVRPYNFILFSFILLVLGIEFVKEPIAENETQIVQELNQEQLENFGNREFQLDEKSSEDDEQKESAQLMDQILGLDTGSLISRFLPVLLWFILISKLIENALRKIFKNETEFGYVYIYGIASSCSVFAIILMLFRATDAFNWITNISDEFFAGIFISVTSIAVIMIIFPAFLVTKTLKFLDIKFLRRSLVFLILLVFNFGITMGYLFVLFPDDTSTVEPVFESTLDEYVDFDVQSVEKTENGIKIFLSHSYPSSFSFYQNTGSWIDATNFFVSPTSGLFWATAEFYNKSREDEYFQVKSFMNNELTLSIEDSVELAVFDSLYAVEEYFRIELSLTDENGLFKYGVIELNEESNTLSDVDFSN
jgi:hypothetical protein